MTTYTVHHRESDPAAILADPDSAVFVKDGFCWPAAILPYLWFPLRGLWLVLLGYLIVVVAMALIIEWLGLSEPVATVAALALNLAAGFEGYDLRRWTLRRRGLHEVGVVIARSLPEAESRFFEMTGARNESSTAPAAAPPAPSIKRPMRPRADEAAGLFPAPGRIS